MTELFFVRDQTTDRGLYAFDGDAAGTSPQRDHIWLYEAK